MAEATCPVCSRVFNVGRRGQRCCDKRCGKQWANATRRGAVVRPVHVVAPPFGCEHCERMVTPGVDADRKATRFCGSRCKKAWHYAAARRDAGECRPESLRRRTAKRRLAKAADGSCGEKPWFEYHCPGCGGRFLFNQPWQRVFCSTRCKRRVDRVRARVAGTSDDGNHRRRARAFGVAYEPVARRRVFDRDKWVCQLCGRAVKRSVKAPHPLSASLDHIVPMSRGGGHLYVNVQCAHFLCNSLKGAGVSERGEQLRLIG